MAFAKFIFPKRFCAFLVVDGHLDSWKEDIEAWLSEVSRFNNSININNNKKININNSSSSSSSDESESKRLLFVDSSIRVQVVVTHIDLIEKRSRKEANTVIQAIEDHIRSLCKNESFSRFLLKDVLFVEPGVSDPEDEKKDSLAMKDQL